MLLGDSAVSVRLIVGSIADEGGEWTGDLVEQRLDLRAIVNIAAGQVGCENLSSLSVNAD